MGPFMRPMRQGVGALVVRDEVRVSVPVVSFVSRAGRVVVRVRDWRHFVGQKSRQPRTQLSDDERRQPHGAASGCGPWDPDTHSTARPTTRGRDTMDGTASYLASLSQSSVWMDSLWNELFHYATPVYNQRETYNHPKERILQRNSRAKERKKGRTQRF